MAMPSYAFDASASIFAAEDGETRSSPMYKDLTLVNYTRLVLHNISCFRYTRSKYSRHYFSTRPIATASCFTFLPSHLSSCQDWPRSEEMTSSSSSSDFFMYTPSLAAAANFSALFLAATLLHSYQLFRTRTWYLIPPVLGGCCEWIG